MAATAEPRRLRESATTAPAVVPAPIEIDLGARIRALRLARRETLRALAGRAGVTESFLSQVQRGVASPSIASVQRIARALDTSIAELFEEPERVGEIVPAAERRRVSYTSLGAGGRSPTRAGDRPLHVLPSYVEPG